MNNNSKGEFGAILRRRREELGLSLDDLAASTRIRKTYLQALEEENLQVLPGTAYSIGFLRIYARQLGVSVEPLLAALDGAETRHDVQPPAGIDSPRTVRKPKQKSMGGRQAFLLAFLAVVTAVFFYVRMGDKADLPRPVAPVPAAALPAASPVVAPPVTALPAPSSAVASPVAALSAPKIPVTELLVLPSEGAIVRMLPVAVGVAKVSLDNQETREYQLQPDQSLNWKVSTTLAVELSAPGLVRVWVDRQELAVAEYPAYVLKGVARQERQP